MPHAPSAPAAPAVSAAPSAPSAPSMLGSRSRLAKHLVWLPLLLVVGCSKGPKERLSGKWVGDRIDNVSADDVARATGWVKGTSFEFAGDKVTVTIPAEAARTGIYKVTKIEGDKMVLAVTRPDRALTDEATLTLLDEKTMRWDLGQTREVVLVRVQ